MKINKKYFDAINTNPIDIQETKAGNLRIYSMNEYPEIHSSNTAKASFTFWSNKGGNEYKLLIDEEYYNTLRPLYDAKISEVWLEFYDTLTKERNKMLLKIMLPITIVMFALIILTSVLLIDNSSMRMYITVLLLIIFFVVNRFFNIKVDKHVAAIKDKSIDKIRNILGTTKFEELLTSQEKFVEAYYKKQYIEKYGEDGYSEPSTQVDESLENNETQEISEETNTEE